MLFSVYEFKEANIVGSEHIIVAILSYPVIIPTSPKIVFTGKVLTSFYLNYLVYWL